MGCRGKEAEKMDGGGGACSLVSGRVRQSKDSWQHTSLPTPAFLHQLGSHNQNIQMQAGEMTLCHFDPNGIFMIVLSMFMTSVRRKSRMPSKMTPLGEDVDISTDKSDHNTCLLLPWALHFF